MERVTEMLGMIAEGAPKGAMEEIFSFMYDAENFDTLWERLGEGYDIVAGRYMNRQGKKPEDIIEPERLLDDLQQFSEQIGE
jgi:hypothetical protein